MMKLGGRKLLVSVVVLITGLGITLAKGDIPANFLQLLEVVLGAFVSGNILAQVFEKPQSMGTGVVAGSKESEDLRVPVPSPEGVPVEPSEVMPVDIVVAAFEDLGKLANFHAAEHAKSLEALTKAVVSNNQVVTALVEKLSR